MPAIHALTPSERRPGRHTGRRLTPSRPAALLAALLAVAGGAPPAAASAAEATIVARAIRLDGGAGLPRAGLEALTVPYLNRPLTLSDVEELRYRLTRHLVEQGYINSGAVLAPEQDAAAGVLRYELIAGQLEAIEVRGQGRLRADYIERRLRDAPSAAFNRERLRERFQLLLEDPLILRVDGQLQPGSAPGRAALTIDVERARPWEAYLRTDNHRPPSTGAERVYAGGTLRNPSGLGDSLEGYLGFGYEGQGREGAFTYSLPLPLGAGRARLFAGGEYTDATLLEQPLADLEIASETRRLEFGAGYQWMRRIDATLDVSLRLSWGENETSLLGEPFSFSAGAIDGESRVSALRLAVEYSRRLERQAFALRSQLSLGVDAFDATVGGHDVDATAPDGRLPDGEFVAWLGQFSYARKLTDSGWQLNARALAQLAGERLLALEQLAIGGADTVRGYRENERVGDSGYAASLELLYPLWSGTAFDQPQTLQLLLFSDVGAAWNHGQFEDRATLFSAGVGLTWTLAERLRAELSWAHPFERPLPQDSHDWQDDGLNFLVQWNF